MNKIIIKGRLTSDPELKKTPSEVSLCCITVAVDRDYTPKGAEKLTDFFNVEIWHGAAEFVSKYFTKGQEILISGRMQSEPYTDKNGNKRVYWKIVADSCEFCGSKQNRTEQTEETQTEDDSDLPF